MTIKHFFLYLLLSTAYLTAQDAVLNIPGTYDDLFAPADSLSYSTYDFELKELVGLNNFSLSLLPSIITTSYNSQLPHGANDGSQWQGVGFNMTIFSGIQVDIPYLTMRLAPEFWLSENREYDVNDATGTSFWSAYTSYVPRPGSDFLADINFGQSEIRFHYGFFDLGFGTSNMVFGPAVINPLVLSNNSAGFPKFDLGINKAELLNIFLDFRLFAGKINETYLSGMSFGISPRIFRGLTLGFSRTLAMNWEDLTFIDSIEIITPDLLNADMGHDRKDQRASLFADWRLINSGFRFYFEYFREDHSSLLKSFLLYPQHSGAFTLGAEKDFRIKDNKKIHFLFELTQLEQSRNYLLDGASFNYYMHHIVTQGHVYKGQYLGPWIGPGSDSQTLIIKYIDDWGHVGIIGQRINFNKDYVYNQNMTDPTIDLKNFYTQLSAGVDALYKLKYGSVFAEFTYYADLNWNYVYDNDYHSFKFELGYIF